MPYPDAFIEAFGMGHIVFGSAWPDMPGGRGVLQNTSHVNGFFESFLAGGKAAFFGGNTIEFYNLK